MKTEQVAELLGVDGNTARGLLKFMVDVGLITTEEAEKEAGKKGRPATLYNITRQGIDKLHDLLVEKLGVVEKKGFVKYGTTTTEPVEIGKDC
jgi:predicted ArsR family transcriptional regulator